MRWFGALFVTIVLSIAVKFGDRAVHIFFPQWNLDSTDLRWTTTLALQGGCMAVMWFLLDRLLAEPEPLQPPELDTKIDGLRNLSKWYFENPYGRWLFWFAIPVDAVVLLVIPVMLKNDMSTVVWGAMALTALTLTKSIAIRDHPAPILDPVYKKRRRPASTSRRPLRITK